MNFDEKRHSTTAERLRERMKELDMKQADVVRATGIDKGALSSYLSGKYEPKDKTIFKLAKALNVDEMWLWGYDVPKERKSKSLNDEVTIPASLNEKTKLAADIVIRLGKDDIFCESVKLLYKLDEIKLKNVKALLEGLVE